MLIFEVCFTLYSLTLTNVYWFSINPHSTNRDTDMVIEAEQDIFFDKNPNDKMFTLNF